jgi:hypothetical protein
VTIQTKGNSTEYKMTFSSNIIPELSRKRRYSIPRDPYPMMETEFHKNKQNLVFFNEEDYIQQQHALQTRRRFGTINLQTNSNN